MWYCWGRCHCFHVSQCMLSSIVVVVIVTEFVCINFSEFFDVDVYVVGGGDFFCS